MFSDIIIPMKNLNVEEIQIQLRHYVQIKMGWNDSVYDQWYVTKNRNFEGMSPKEIVESGGGRHLVAYVKGL